MFGEAFVVPCCPCCTGALRNAFIDDQPNENEANSTRKAFLSEIGILHHLRRRWKTTHLQRPHSRRLVAGPYAAGLELHYKAGNESRVMLGRMEKRGPQVVTSDAKGQSAHERGI